MRRSPATLPILLHKPGAEKNKSFWVKYKTQPKVVLSVGEILTCCSVNQYAVMYIIYIFFLNQEKNENSKYVSDRKCSK